MMDKETADELISAAIELHLTEESGRKSSLEQRAVAAITVAGVLVTALAALTSVGVRSGTKAVGGVPAWCLDVAAILFAFGAVAAMLAIAPFRYASARIEDLNILVTPEVFRGSKQRVDRRLAELRLAQLDSFRKGNSFKSLMVISAFAFLAAALTCLTIGIVV